MAKIARRDTDSLGALYDAHAPHCLALAERILKDRAESEDLLQDIFFKVWEAPEKYSAARGSVGAWLVSTVRSRAIDRLRRRGSRSRATERATDRLKTFAVAPGRLSSTVALALDELPGTQRDIVELAYFNGLTQSEIAKQLSVPLGTVKSRLRLGLKRLRDAFATLGRSGEPQ
jgi:RNA polymerase sigma-70 factor, ECF subfamily